MYNFTKLNQQEPQLLSHPEDLMTGQDALVCKLNYSLKHCKTVVMKHHSIN